MARESAGLAPAVEAAIGALVGRAQRVEVLAAARTRVSGRVTGVSYEDGYTELVLERGYRVAMGDVREV